jgi:hypothetical protein
MGLDLIAEGCAKPGHEAEWRRIVERAFADDELTDAETARFQEICIPAYERVGAPRVGYDSAADAWIIETRKAGTPDEVEAVLKDFHGYHVLALVESDGVPLYSSGGLNPGIDETSFRGAFLSACDDVLRKDLIDSAWEHKLPEAAIEYGRALLAAADAAAGAGPKPAPDGPPPKRGLFSFLKPTKKAREPIPFEEQVQIVQAAGRWYVFWGERGHPIRAWF